MMEHHRNDVVTELVRMQSPPPWFYGTVAAFVVVDILLFGLAVSGIAWWVL